MVFPNIDVVARFSPMLMTGVRLQVKARSEFKPFSLKIGEHFLIGATESSYTFIFTKKNQYLSYF